MSWITTSMDLEDDQAKTRSTDLNEFTVRGGKSLYKSIKPIASIILMVKVFSLPSSWGISYIIYLSLDHLDPTLVGHLSLYLSTCPIRHSFWLSVSCDSQGSTVQRSSPHKCGQKSSCSTFNAVVAAFP